VIDPGSVREATADDASEIARIRVDSWRAAYAGIVPGHLLDGMEASAFAERLAPRLGTPDHGVLVMRAAAGAIRGFAIAAPSRDDDAAGEGEIQAIYLAPEARGQGIGGPLLEAACAWLADQGFEMVLLWVLTANDPARRFYARLGFVPDGATRMLDFDGTPIEEIRYRRSIARRPVPSA
jgi:GNAT superfamily N-acetyltransferase